MIALVVVSAFALVLTSIVATALPELVEMALMRRTELGKTGYVFASQFTIERFESEWKKVLKG